MEIAKISILVPTFNRRKFLPLLLRNIKIQDYPHDKLEVIIDDDGKDKLIINDQQLSSETASSRTAYLR